MDIRTQINKELDEAKAVLMEALSQKKTGARQAAPGKTWPSSLVTSSRLQGTLFQTWEAAFKNKMIRNAMQRIGPKGRRGLVTAERLQMIIS